MSQPPNILDLPEEDLAAILATVRQRYNEARQALEKVNEDIEKLTEKQRGLADKVSRYQVFISFSHENLPEANHNEQAQEEPQTHEAAAPAPNAPSQPEANVAPIESEYANLSTQYEKMLYITDRPYKYGKVSFVGARPVIEALRKEEPELAEVSDDIMMKRIGPALSHLGSTGRLIRLAERKHRLNVHYLSTKWFENGALKPEYQQMLRPFDLVPVPAKRPNPSAQLGLDEQADSAEKLGAEQEDSPMPSALESDAE